MRDEIVDVLLRIGIPANVKGFTYIHDAIDLFDTDPYYPGGKICSLYEEIARKHDTTAPRVERAIRHAFEVTIAKGNKEMVMKYLDMVNTQNSNLLRTLYFRMKPELNHRKRLSGGDANHYALKKEIFTEVMDLFSLEMESVLMRIMRTDNSHLTRTYLLGEILGAVNRRHMEEQILGR